ncbi:MAG: hypothetical protein ABIU05_19535 [Nitrospirales bacterium]
MRDIYSDIGRQRKLFNEVMMTEGKNLPLAELETELDMIRQSPKQKGMLPLIVCRPANAKSWLKESLIGSKVSSEIRGASVGVREERQRDEDDGDRIEIIQNATCVFARKTMRGSRHLHGRRGSWSILSAPADGSSCAGISAERPRQRDMSTSWGLNPLPK